MIHFSCVGVQVRSWLDDWESEATQAREAMAAAAADDYKFAENNPFLNVSIIRPASDLHLMHWTRLSVNLAQWLVTAQPCRLRAVGNRKCPAILCSLVILLQQAYECFPHGGD